MYSLRPYQQEAVDATITHFRKSNEPAVIVLPTGAGKSLVIAELARLAKRKILVLTHVKELVEQNHQKFNEYAEQAQIKSGIFAAGLNRKETHQQVTFASVQSVARNLAQFAQEYSLVVIDECHRVNYFDNPEGANPQGTSFEAEQPKNSNQYSQIVSLLKEHNPSLKILGLTATPFRLGMGWIYQYHYYGFVRSKSPKPFKHCIYELPLTYMIKHGFLTPPTLIDAAVEQFDFSQLPTNAFGEYNENDVNELLGKYPRVTQGIVEQIQLIADGQSPEHTNKVRSGVMIFAATVKHAKEIVGYLQQKLTQSASDKKQSIALVTAKTSADDREHMINDFKAKKIRYLVNVSVLTTGFDAPHVDFIAILRPTQSVSLYQQIVGRGLRLAEGKTDCLVIDYAGNGINIFYPEVGEPKPNSKSELVQVFCPACGFANTFWGIADKEGNVLEHYGRQCQGILDMPQEDGDASHAHQSLSQPANQHTTTHATEHETPHDKKSAESEIFECDYRFVFKECPQCNAQNDIAARQCHQCEHQLVDPDDKLKEALKLSDRMVIRCSGMTFSEHNNSLKIVYYDEDGAELKEFFDLSSEKHRKTFNDLFGRRFRNSQEPTEFKSLAQVLKQYVGFPIPDFVIAKKSKKYWQVQERVFDYQGKFRTANALR